MLLLRAAILLCLAQAWTQSFPVDLRTLATEGESPYFILKPGYQATFEGRSDGKAGKLVITVLNETLNVGGVDTRVVEEREWSGGGLIEVSRNYFAIHPPTGDVYYFGEDVDMYKKGKVVNHEGSWRHGASGATFGLIMPGKPVVGMKFYQEQAKGVAMDRSEIVDRQPYRQAHHARGRVRTVREDTGDHAARETGPRIQDLRARGRPGERRRSRARLAPVRALAGRSR